ncbi:MAG: ATP-binding protein [Planctomycetota bacterium]
MADQNQQTSQSPDPCQEDFLELGIKDVYSALLEIFPGAVLVASDSECNLVEGNARAQELFGMEEGGNLSMNNPSANGLPYRIYDGQRQLAPEDLPLQTAAREGRSVLNSQLTIRFDDGRVKDVMINAGPLMAEDKQVCGAIATIMDISEQVQDRRRLAELTANLEARARALAGKFVDQSNQLRALALQLTEAEHTERLRIARILHDRFQQLLVGAKFKLGTLGVRLEKAEQDDLADLTGRIEKIIDESLEATRNLAMELSTPVLYDGGLASAIHWLVDRMKSRHGLCLHAECEIPDDSLELDLRVLFFDCIQELLLNIVKHAGVQDAAVRVWQDQDNQARIEVSDAGKGMDTAILDVAVGKQNSFGLFHLAQRVESIGGQIRIQSKPGDGTTVLISAPLDQSPTGYADAPQGMGPLEQQSDLPQSSAASILLAGGPAWLREATARLLRDWPDVSVVAQQASLDGLESLAMVLQPDLVLVMEARPEPIESLARSIEQSGLKMQILLLGCEMAELQPVPACVTCIDADATAQQLVRKIRALAGRQ